MLIESSERAAYARALSSSAGMSAIPEACLFLHARSSRIRHSLCAPLLSDVAGVDEQDAIRARIEERIKALDLSVTAAAEQSGLGKTTVRNFLKGMTRSFTVGTAHKLAPTLKVSPQWLLYGEDGAEIIGIYSRVPPSRRSLAKKVLLSLTDETEQTEA